MLASFCCHGYLDGAAMQGDPDPLISHGSLRSALEC